MERLEYQGTDTFRFREILNILKVIFVDVIFQALNYIYLRAASGASITNCRSACNVSYCRGCFLKMCGKFRDLKIALVGPNLGVSA